MFFRVCWPFLVALLACPLVSASSVGRQRRQASNACTLPKFKPLINRLAKEFPKPAVNAFCSAVVGKNGLPKTTVTTFSTITITETVVDTYSSTATICETRIGKRAPAPATTTPTAVAAPTAAPAALVRDAKGGALGFGPDILTKACQCVLPTSTKIVSATETRTEYDFQATTLTFSTTVTITKPLPTFRARGKEASGAIRRDYLQSSQILNEQGQAFTNALVNVSSKALGTTFSLSCEGYLLQANTSALGEDRLLAVLDFAVSQQPIYFDPDRRVDTADSGAKPLICKVEAGELRCSSFQKVLNQFQYCRSYEEFFGTGILLTASQGPNCMLFTVAVEPL